MRNILFALAVGLVTFGVFSLPFHLKEAAVPGVLGVLVSYFILARRSFKSVEIIFTRASKHLQTPPPKFELAIRTMEEAYTIAPYQIGVKTQIDAQIGALFFLQKEFNKAMPYLQRSLGFGHWLSGAMLGVIYYKKKNHEEMRKTFAVVTKRAKKQGIVWNLYAYLLCQIGERDEAQQILVQGLKKTNDDSKIKDSLLNLQNGKKIKMKVYKEQWYQFHLERPPTQYAQGQAGGKLTKQQRRGRW